MTCRAEAPAVAEVHATYGDAVAFVGIAGRDGIEPINDFIDEFSVGEFPHVVDESGAIWDNFGIVTQPSFIFLDSSGEFESHVGALGVDGITERVERLVES